MNFRAFLFVAATFLASTLAFAQSSPLIMYHADNLDVSRKRGTLLLTGNVHFVHDSVAFKRSAPPGTATAKQLNVAAGSSSRIRPDSCAQGTALIKEKAKLRLPPAK